MAQCQRILRNRIYQNNANMGITIRNQDNENAFVINALDGQSSMIGQSHLYQHTSANMNLDTGENSLAVNSQEMIDHDQVNLEDSLDTA